MPGQGMARARAREAVAGRAGQADLEEAEEVRCEQRHQKRHGDQEGGLLELDAPAHGEAGGLDRDGGPGEHHERGHDPRRRGQEGAAHGPSLTPTHGDDTEELDGEDRQHAGHEVEDQTAEERQCQDDGEARPGHPRRGRGRYDRDLHGAAAIDEGEDQRLTDGAGETVDDRAHRGPQERRAATVGEARHRRLEGVEVGPLDEEVGCLEGLPRPRHHFQHLSARGAGQGGAIDGEAVGRAVPRHALGEAFDAVGEFAGCRRAGRQVEGQVDRVGDADFAAGEEIDPRPQRQRPARRREPRRDREHHRALIAESVESEDAEALRRRPAQHRPGQIGGSGPVGPGREPGRAGRAPIDLPARLHAEFESEHDRRPFAHGLGGRDEARLGIFVARPVGGGRRLGHGRDHERRGQDEREAGDTAYAGGRFFQNRAWVRPFLSGESH